MLCQLCLILVLASSLHAIPRLDQGEFEGIAPPPHRLLLPHNTTTTSPLSDSTFSPINMIGAFCQGSGDIDQCGGNNCECWSTGTQASNGGSNYNRIYCNDQGYFCWSGGDCYPYPCMDKSADTKVLNFNYLPEINQLPVPEAVFVHYIDNYLNETQTGFFTWQESVSTEYSWSWSETSSVSVSLESTVGLPDVCSVHDSVTTSVSTTKGQTQTNSNVKGWGTQQNFQVPPMSTVKLAYVVSKLQFTVPYQQTVQFGGAMGLWCSNSVNGHHFWMPDSGSILQASPLCDYNVCTFSGTFVGVQGVSDSTTYMNCPLGTRC